MQLVMDEQKSLIFYYQGQVLKSIVKTFDLKSFSYNSNSSFLMVFFTLFFLFVQFELFLYFTPLMYAAMNGHDDVVNLLLSQPDIKIDLKSIFKKKINLFNFKNFIF